MNGSEIDLMTVVLMRWASLRRAWKRQAPTKQIAIEIELCDQALQALAAESMSVMAHIPDAVAIVDMQTGQVLAITETGPGFVPDPDPDTSSDPDPDPTAN